MSMMPVVIVLSFLIGAWLTLFIYKLLSGRKWLADRWDEYKLNRTTLQEASTIWLHTPKSSIVVSLTSIPSRISHIEQVLKSLLTQSLAPAKIKLYLPKFSKRDQCAYSIPESLRFLQGLEIIQTEEFGPATKFIPALMSHEQDQPLLIVDDDKLYDRHFVKRFAALMRLHPDCVIASSGWIVPSDLIDKPTTLFRNLFLIPPTPIHCSRIHTPRYVDIIMGCSGYLIRPRFFDLADLLNRDNAPDALWYVDDVWISAHCAVPKIVFPAPRLCFESLTLHSGFRKTSLTLINRQGVNGHRNNTIGVQFFSLKWTISNKSRFNQ